MIDFSSLNSNQLQSVEWNNGALLVLAGPGSGKTRVLTYRIARMIEATPDKYFKILGLTFTNRAAAEMRQRITSLVPNSSDRTLLSTFHSFSVGLLRQHGYHVGIRPDFTILSQAQDRKSLLAEAIKLTISNPGHPQYGPDRLLTLVTRLMDYCVPSDKGEIFLQRRRVNGADILGEIYSNYRNLMVEKNELDFGALIAEAIRLLECNQVIRSQIMRIYPYVCVDEFQDTTYAQYRLLQNIVNTDTKNLFVVADDDQIIYQWNGADPERLNILRNDFDMSVLQLPENYRCPPRVIRIANKLIKHNDSHDKSKVDLIAHKLESKHDVIRVKELSCFEEESEWVASDIATRLKDDDKNIVVLARNRRLLEVILESMEFQGLDGFIAVRKDEFVSYPMVWLHAMLRLANARQDEDQLRRICNSFLELKGVSLRVGDIVSDAAAEEGDLLRAWFRAIAQDKSLDSTSRHFLTNSMVTLAERLDFWTFIKESFNWFGQIPEFNPLAPEGTLEYEEEKSAWTELISEIIGEYGRDQITLYSLLQGFDLRSKTPAPPKDAIPCFTIHASKGLEFDHVYLVGLVEDQIPSWQAIKKGGSSREMQEERRNCFVAITRAQESLTLTYSHEVFGWTKEPSRFLKEMELVG